ncbi:MAG: N-acetylglucosamine-6-phosphate deacetylase [Betaproteobacteria bacterium]|nr:N-acetylglucosamine-6-phosphate deacetylase [Betaproteobacteria bacterium]
MTVRTLDGHILTPAGFVRGALAIGEIGRITAITGDAVASDAVRDSALPILLPGFIDCHVHGGAGHDIMEGGRAAAHIARLHAEHGTTSLLATTMTAPHGDLEKAFSGLAAVLATAQSGQGRPFGARILGVHLEGPYINPGKLGAQPDFARALLTTELRELSNMASIRLITLAPEMPGNLDVIRALCDAGYRVQLGHSLATYEEGVAALERGAAGFTHLFNAMSAFHHREPGLAGAALAHATYAEIIPDLLHVHPGAVRVALKSIPRLFCVTDSTSATGMPDGEYRLGRHTVTKCMGGVRLADGTLAGSTLTLDQALRNLVSEFGLDLAEASARVSTFAADYLGETERGRLAPGAWADIVCLDRDLTIQNVFVEGVSRDDANA